ncbi:hypothetical protein HYALB_00010247 [Hymenoscyphus albidus]|uniref:Uncharacterized protein n=1 Tax=Hymenoscyphus albidus TaxID=595503 RepID=A0A9N9LNL8_9HELO|nr:hypothetical protein HYALB_00010247 [Hymenoscyphus albidus]
MTATREAVTKKVLSAMCLWYKFAPISLSSPASVLASDFDRVDLVVRARSLSSKRMVPLDQNTGPVQFDRKVRTPTARTLYPLTPLYAELKSMLEIAFEPPIAKNEQYGNVGRARLGGEEEG